ncbi:MAG: hypothetical protein V7739_06865 [Motiliproteus sp.]
MTATPLANPHDELTHLINETGNKELECREFVSLSRELFVQNTAATNILHEESEYRGHTGDSDLIVICEQSSGGINTRQAYVWEIKAPQCYLFEKCNNNRVRPTADFIKAENQLLHYYEELKSTQFVSEFGLNHPENVKLGGILIGNTNTLVRGSYDTSTSLRLYTRAHELRQRYLYGHSNIKIMIWNDVLDYLKVAEPITKSSEGYMESISLSSGSKGDIFSSEGSI